MPLNATIFVLDGLLWAYPGQREEHPLFVKWLPLGAKGRDEGIPVHCEARLQSPPNSPDSIEVRRVALAHGHHLTETIEVSMIRLWGELHVVIVIHSVLHGLHGAESRFRFLSVITIVLFEAKVV